MPLTIVNSLDKQLWQEFVEQNPQGNIFHTPEMFLVFSQAKRHNPEIWAAVNGEKVLALLSPVRISVFDGFLGSISTRSVVYGSVLHNPDKEGMEALTFLLKTYINQVEKKPIFTELRNLSNLEPIQPILRSQGFEYEAHLNYLIDLKKSTDDIFLSIGSRTRKKLRRGLNKGEVIVEEINKIEQLPICYELLKQTYKAAKVPLADYSLFESAFDLLYPKGMIKFSLAKVNNRPAAISIELLFKKVMYGWYGGMDRGFKSYFPNEILTWHILKWGAENGFELYDFGGAGKPNEEYGVRDYKAKFGGTLVCYGRNTYVHSQNLFSISKIGYRLLRPMYKY